MNKKIVCIIGLTFFLIITIFVQPIAAQEEKQNFEATLFAIGFIYIDSENYKIKGFALTGNNEGEILFFDYINIQYDGTPIFVSNPLPFIFRIKYNPV
jgi:hypothetical protein